jgi:pimeloyl-ACP methyl ester carboxylesterase
LAYTRDLAYYVEQYRISGFRGGLNWYRNVPTNNSITPELESKRFAQPAAFLAGTADDVLLYDPNWRTTFPKAFDDLRFIELVEGAGHWVQMERPKETTALILRFLQSLWAPF